MVDEVLANSVTFGSGFSSPSMLSVPVGPQSINPATVVVRPSWDLSMLSHFSCLLALSNNLIVSPLFPLDKAAGASAITAERPPVCSREYLNWQSLHAAFPLCVGFRCCWPLTFGPIPALLSLGGGIGLKSRWANGLTVLQWSLLGVSQRGCKRGLERGTDLGVSLIPGPWLRGLHTEKSRVRWVIANRIHTRCPTQLPGLKADGLQRKERVNERNRFRFKHSKKQYKSSSLHPPPSS